MSFSCPLCHQPLSREKNSYICPQRHQFDMAKEGYVNLLPVQHKRSRDPGDSAEMMQARRAFLDAGHYQPLRDAIVAQLRERLDDKATAVLDIGCGEGYYTHAFADALPEITTFGLDVSKVAIKAAAKRYPQVTFCVASSHRLPFSDTDVLEFLVMSGLSLPHAMAMLVPESFNEKNPIKIGRASCRERV